MVELKDGEKLYKAFINDKVILCDCNCVVFIHREYMIDDIQCINCNHFIEVDMSSDDFILTEV